MTQPENFTAAQASDPQTPGQVLADIAALRPDLRVAVASNPSTYPGLLEWLGSMGEPAVDAAIAARRAAIQQTQQMPTLPPAAPPAPSWAGQPAAQAPAPMVTPGYPGMPPQGGAPGLQYAGMPPQGGGPGLQYAGMPPQGGGPGLQYAGMPPQGGAPGLQYAGTAPKKSNSALWIILGVVGLIILLTIGAVIFFINRAKNVVEDLNLDDITNNLIGGNHGDNPTLDALWDACATEDWASCDQLHMESVTGSEYGSFGDTCGNRTDGSQLCVVELGSGAAPSEPNAYGDSTTLDALYTACAAEDWQACDDLYMQSGVGTAYEVFGDTCGNRTDGGLYCVDELGSGAPSEPNAYGDDTTLDALWNACTAEDWQACDDLYMQSGAGTAYESFGDTCGNRTDGGLYCVDELGGLAGAGTYGDDPYFDGLWDLCTAGDWQSCDDLYLESDVGSGYETYGDTCGNKYAAGTTDYCVDVMP